MQRYDPIATVWQDVLDATTCTIGRIAYLAGLCDPKTGRYRQSRLSQDIGIDDADYGMRIVHEFLWKDWLRCSLEQQFVDILAYFRGISEDTFTQLTETQSFVHLAPSSADEQERLFFDSTLQVLFARLKPNAISLTISTNMRNVPTSAIAKAVRIVHELYSDAHLSINTVCRNADLSERHLRKIFKNCTGKTFCDYLREVRIFEAVRLLQKSTLSVKVIAGMVGYSSPSHFGVDFRSITGQTAKQFRTKELSSTLLRSFK